MKRASAAAAVALVLTAAQARAQQSGSEPALVLVLGPPVLISVALDVVLLSTLVPDGTTGRGRSISTIVFSVIGMTFSIICLVAGLTSSSSSVVWNALSAASLAVEVGSFALGIYGAAHAPEEPEAPPVPSPARERLYRPSPQKDPIPQLLMMLPLSFEL